MLYNWKLDLKIKLGNSLQISRDVFSYIVVYFDLVSMLISFIGIIVILVSKVNTEEYFKNEVIQIGDYILFNLKIWN